MKLWHYIRHGYRVARFTLRERLKSKTRNDHWPVVEHCFLRDYPRCAACGSTIRLRAHHVKPVRLFSRLELLWSNLIPLCMGPAECHERIGHGGDWRSYNPMAASDAEIVRVNPDLREEYEARAKAQRLAIGK